jgi:hypothetical protein
VSRPISDPQAYEPNALAFADPITIEEHLAQVDGCAHAVRACDLPYLDAGLPGEAVALALEGWLS